MLTFFAMPKAFRGHIEVIQRNAIRSWTLLQPRAEIILFGTDDGTAEVAKEFGLRHVPHVARNEFGTPLINDLFAAAEREASNDLICYINADIILTSDFLPAVERVRRRKKKFLMVGQRWDLEITQPLQFEQGWETRLRQQVEAKGKLLKYTGIDYFVFTRGLWGDIPPFAIGRTQWDNWLLWRARNRRAPMIDATDAVFVIHQNHDYNHNPQGMKGIWHGPEAKRNTELAAGNFFTLRDATHFLTPTRLKWAFDSWHVRRHVETLPQLRPAWRLPMRALTKTMQWTHALRRRLGLALPAGGPRETEATVSRNSSCKETNP
jgi:hypothetical protein